MKIKPYPALFLADSAWFGLLAGFTVWQIVNGVSTLWLIAVALQLMLLVSGINHFNNFTNFEDSPGKPTGAAS